MTISSPLIALNSNATALQRMLINAGHTVNVNGKCWMIDNKMAYWPGTGKYEMSTSMGGKGGTLRGRAESNFEQIERSLLVGA